MRSTFAPILALLILTACGSSGSEQAVGGVTADEAAQLNDAAEMLDASPDGLRAPDNMSLDVEDEASGGHNGS